MSFGVLNMLMLAGLAGVSIPIIIHLLNRRRYNVVDWGAMQFLQLSETTRRRLMIEELLLMLLRMALIAILVLALAAPFVESDALARLGGGDRDVVLIFDGSYSMGYSDKGPSAHEAAKEWAQAFVNDLSAGDSVSVLQAKQQVVPVLGTPTVDLDRARDKIANLPAPAGGCDWPSAVQAAHKILAKSNRSRRDIIILSDNQRFGWADDNSLIRWELLANTLRDDSSAAVKPKIWVVNLAPNRPATTANWSLSPLTVSRAVASANQQVTFRTALVVRGQEYAPPHDLYVEVDGKRVVSDLKAPATAKLENGQVALSFHHRFTTPGTHLVSVTVEPDPPLSERPAGYAVKDRLPGDNRQDYAIEVLPALPVVLVDGDDKRDTKARGTDFLRDALAPARDLTPAVLAKVVRIDEFDADTLSAPINKDWPP
jgi:hypothetical protein